MKSSRYLYPSLHGCFHSVLVWHVSWKLCLLSYTLLTLMHVQTLFSVCSCPCFTICLCPLFSLKQSSCDKALCDKCFINKSHLIWLPSKYYDGRDKNTFTAGLHQWTMDRGKGRRREAFRQHYAGWLKFNWTTHDLNEISCQECMQEMQTEWSTFF